MKKGQTYEGIVLRVDYPNKGQVRPERAAAPSAAMPEPEADPVLVKNVLPGERISFRLKKKRRGRWEGECLERLAPGPGAEKALCPKAGICGGCAYQGLSYEAQLKLKEEQVRRILDQAMTACGLDDGYGWEGIAASPVQTDYRNKMEFTFGDEYKDGPLSLGLHKRGAFYDIVPADGCRICDPDFGRILRATLDFFAEAGIPYYHRMRHTGYLRHLLIRKGRAGGEILVDLVTAGPQALQTADADGEELKSFPEETILLTKWKDSLLALEQQNALDGHFAGILHTKNDRLGDVIADEGTQVLNGKAFYTEEILGLTFKVSPFSFFQTNSAGAQVLYQIVRDYLGETSGRRVYDLYSGTGTIAQILAPAAEHVTGVEIVPEAVDAARDNAALNGLTNCDFLCGDVFEVLDRQLAAGEGPDLIVLDPPREGVRPDALRKILGYGAERMVYVSCQITSLARDLPVLTEHGYRPVRTCSVDMFPYTAGIETVILMTKRQTN